MEKEEKKKHTCVSDKKGYCKVCGKDLSREKGKHEDEDKEVDKEGKEHPDFPKKTIHKIVEDHEKKK